MRRLFWVGVGAVGTVVLARRIRTVAHRYAPAAVTDQVQAAGRATTGALQEAAQTLRTAMAQREKDLVSQLLVTPEAGDPGAFRRTAAVAEDGVVVRPPGRVDDDEPLYDF